MHYTQPFLWHKLDITTLKKKVTLLSAYFVPYLQEKNMKTTVILLTEIQISSLSSKDYIFFVHG